MKQITKHDVNKLSVAKLKEMLPFEVVADGEVIFVACDVNKLNPISKHDVNKLEGMAFWNKAAQECLDRNARAGELLRKVQKLN